MNDFSGDGSKVKIEVVEFQINQSKDGVSSISKRMRVNNPMTFSTAKGVVGLMRNGVYRLFYLLRLQSLQYNRGGNYVTTVAPTNRIWAGIFSGSS